MLQQLVQSTVFVLDVITAKDGDSDRLVWNKPRTRRLRIRETYRYLVPIEKANIADSCNDTPKGEILTVEGKDYLQVYDEVELKYKKIGPGSVDIGEGDEILFSNAGICCMSRACGPAYSIDPSKAEDICEPLRPGPTYEAVENYLRARSLGSPEADYWQGCIEISTKECFEKLINDGAGNALASQIPALEDDRQRLYYFATTASIPHSENASAASDLKDQPKISKRPKGFKVIPGKLLDLSTLHVGPIFWFPLGESEAFAFGTLTNSEQRLHLFGRMGKLTDGYVMTDSVHWILKSDIALHLSLAEEIDTEGNAKYGEFNAGFLTPGDYNIVLERGAKVKFKRNAIPFFFGAMPQEDPTLIDPSFFVSDLEKFPDIPAEFCYLTGSLYGPIVFDPVTNCGPCGS